MWFEGKDGEGVGEGWRGADVACVGVCCVQLVGMRGGPRVFKCFKMYFWLCFRHCYMILRL